MAAKKKKKKSPVRRVISGIGIALLVMGICASFYLMSRASTLIIDAYSFDITKYKMDIASLVYAKDEKGEWTEYEQLYNDQRRLWISLADMPEYIQDATVAIEDERFYTHHGMDLKRTLGATLGFVTGNPTYGGSTITQQLIKNITDDWDDTPERKVKEILRALVLETQMDKHEILEYYLNIVYFGNGCNGVEMASQTYFNKTAAELTLAQSASIVGITNSPKYYDPFEHPDKNKDRQEVILKKMLELGYISQEEHDKAVNEKIDFQNNSQARFQGVNSYFTETMAKEIAADLSKSEGISYENAKNMVYTGGLTIYSTVDLTVQKSMEKWFASGNKSLFPKLSGDVQPQAAMAVIEPKSGALAGVVGGVGEKNASLVLNRATDTTRQPGSSIKPLSAYGPAVELGLLTPSSTIVDEPFEYNNWKPQNWYKSFKGTVTMREAVVQSMNIPAIKTVLQVSIPKSYDFLKNKLCLDTLDEVNDKNLAPLALGGLHNGVTVLDMTAAYATFANGGMYTEPYTYTKVLDKTGKVLLEKKINTHRVFSEKTAQTMTSVLISSAQGPLGISAKPNNMPFAGKTGTTNDDKDRWFMGYTPYYVGGVWYGYDMQKLLPYAATRIAPHKIWQAVMNDVDKTLTYKSFDLSLYGAKTHEKETTAQQPQTKKNTAEICTVTGLVAVEGCPHETKTYESEEDVPTEKCPGNHKTEQPPETGTQKPEQGTQKPEAQQPEVDIPPVIEDE